MYSSLKNTNNAVLFVKLQQKGAKKIPPPHFSFEFSEIFYNNVFYVPTGRTANKLDWNFLSAKKSWQHCGLDLDSKKVERETVIHTEVFYEKCVFKNFAIFTGKHLYWSLKAWNFIKKRLRCFPVNISKFLKTIFFIDHLQWLLL